MKLIFPRAILPGLISLAALSCADEPKETSIPTEEITFTKEGELDLLKNGEITHSLNIEIADTPYEWETGLMYREALGEDQGMLFIYTNEAPRSFYMKNTLIPLDLIFYDKDSSVVSFHENAVPLDLTSIPSAKPAQFILEVNAGKVDEWNIETGDKMKFTRD
ncbi:DUF192 domain-containing protein [Antarcticibacterium sp. 1MA-6-2]|uniref:DUF192 domain-containing protein n=1 Tax=Antarcticibacterium sp. 1MA-6-2 TaxID=2908210 RepID=UPI001F47A667|nr:DUF192 domain-containing protein [Antarcticibacterium sp. 1MA-6-2]UJH89697.1 DUF192 domain-containing protein [Antarcticibacterium sp. 1MA-6-2]